MLEFKIENFIISFPNNIKYETFNEPENYYGIIFFKDNYRYQILESKLGTRLLINGKEGEFKDLPFNINTACMLPDFIKINHKDK